LHDPIPATSPGFGNVRVAWALSITPEPPKSSSNHSVPVRSRTDAPGAWAGAFEVSVTIARAARRSLVWLSHPPIHREPRISSTFSAGLQSQASSGRFTAPPHRPTFMICTRRLTAEAGSCLSLRKASPKPTAISNCRGIGLLCQDTRYSFTASARRCDRSLL
jgi:hypothetical protein